VSDANEPDHKNQKKQSHLIFRSSQAQQMNTVKMNGRLNLIIGPMFSGKSTLLLTRYRRYKIAGKRCLLVKYARDNRYVSSEESIITHDKIQYKAISCHNLQEIDEMTSQYDVICIDEIQFYPDAALYCDLWANRGLIVEACGLNGDFRRQPFEQISLLIPLCDDIQHVKAVCKDTGKDAPFSKRLTDEQEQEVIGSTDKYLAVSRERYFMDTTKK
jgi:thymidine kinase